jgi:hypothetical protein
MALKPERVTKIQIARVVNRPRRPASGAFTYLRCPLAQLTTGRVVVGATVLPTVGRPDRAIKHQIALVEQRLLRPHNHVLTRRRAKEIFGSAILGINVLRRAHKIEVAEKPTIVL